VTRFHCGASIINKNWILTAAVSIEKLQLISQAITFPIGVDFSILGNVHSIAHTVMKNTFLKLKLE
jgi:secreted trypsin-like serine protease